MNLNGFAWLTDRPPARIFLRQLFQDRIALLIAIRQRLMSGTMTATGNISTSVDTTSRMFQNGKQRKSWLKLLLRPARPFRGRRPQVFKRFLASVGQWQCQCYSRHLTTALEPLAVPVPEMGLCQELHLSSSFRGHVSLLRSMTPSLRASRVIVLC